MSNLKDYAEHMLALMDHLQIEYFSVIGLSVGECGAQSWPYLRQSEFNLWL